MSVNILTVALALYALAAMCFMLETYLEGERSGGAWDRCRVCGLFLPVIWPLQLCAVAAVALWGAGIKNPRRYPLI